MNDFVPEDMLTMAIPLHEDHIFLDDVPVNKSVYIRGAYFVTALNMRKVPIDFFIIDPLKKIIYNRRSKNEGIFRINVTTPGTYSFVFSNKRVIKIEL